MRVFKVRGVLGLDRQVVPRSSPVRRSNNAVEAVTKVGDVLRMALALLTLLLTSLALTPLGRPVVAEGLDERR